MQSENISEVEHPVSEPVPEEVTQSLVPVSADQSEQTGSDNQPSIRAFHYFSDVILRHKLNSRSLRTSTFLFLDAAKEHVVEYELFEGLPRAFKRRAVKATEKAKGTSMANLARMTFHSVSLPENVLSFNIIVAGGIIAQSMFRNMGEDLDSDKPTLSAKQPLPFGITGIQTLSGRMLQTALDTLKMSESEIIAGWEVVYVELNGHSTRIVYHPNDERGQTVKHHWQIFVDPNSSLLEQWFDGDDRYDTHLCQDKSEPSTDVEKKANNERSLTPLTKALATALFTFDAAATYVGSGQRVHQREEALRTLFSNMTENVLGDREWEQEALIACRESATCRLSRMLAQQAQEDTTCDYPGTKSEQFAPADGQTFGELGLPESNTSVQQRIASDNVDLTSNETLADSSFQTSSAQPLPAGSDSLAAEPRVPTKQGTVSRTRSFTFDTAPTSSSSDPDASMPQQHATKKRKAKSGNKKNKKKRNRDNNNKNTTQSEAGSQDDAFETREQIESPTRSTSVARDGTLDDQTAQDFYGSPETHSQEYTEATKAVDADSDANTAMKHHTYYATSPDQSTPSAGYGPSPRADSEANSSAKDDTTSDTSQNIIKNQDQDSSESEAIAATAALSNLTIDQPNKQLSAHMMHTRTSDLESSPRQTSDIPSGSPSLPRLPKTTGQPSRITNIGQLPTITEEVVDRTPTKGKGKAVEKTEVGATDATDPEKTPRPRHATVPALPAVPAQPKPAPEVFRFDNYHLETRCRNPECRKATHPLDGTTRICPACGPRSKVRYCHRHCLYKDIRRHFFNECGTLTIEGPIDETSLCADNNARRPFIRYATEQMVNTVERHRQAVWYAMEVEGEYFVFDDVEVCESVTPTVEEVQETRGLGNCIWPIFVPDNMKASFRRALVSSLMWGATPMNSANCEALAGMVMQVLKVEGKWDGQMCTDLCMQMGFEFGYQISPEAQVW